MDQDRHQELLKAFQRLSASCEELLATLKRIAESEASDVIYIPPEYVAETNQKRGRAAGFARAHEIAEQMLGGGTDG